MTNFLLIVTALVPLLVLGVVMIVFARRRWKIAAICVGLTGVHEAILASFPIIHGVFTGFQQEKTMAILVGPDDLLRVMTMEAIFVTFFGAAVLIPFSRTARSFTAREVKRDDNFAIVMAVSALAFYLHTLYQPTLSYEQMSHHADIVVRSLGDSVVAWLRGIMMLPSIYAAALVTASPRYPRWARLAGAVGMFALFYHGLSEGLRGRITTGIALIIVASIMERRWKPLTFAAIGLLLFLPVSSFMAGAYRSTYFRLSYNQGSRWDGIKYLINYARSDNPAKALDMPFVESVARRAQGPRNSVVLLNMHDYEKPAGLRPLLGALVLPIPRLIWPGKPPAGSIDDSNTGMAMYLVRRYGHGSPAFNMGPSLASAHAYWEGGWIWLLVGALATGLFWNAVLTIFARPPATAFGFVFVLTFAGAQLIDGLPTMFNPLWALISVTWSSVLPLLVLYAGVRITANVARWLLSAPPPPVAARETS